MNEKDQIDKLSKIADIVNKKLIALLAIDGAKMGSGIQSSLSPRSRSPEWEPIQRRILNGVGNKNCPLPTI